MALPALPLTIPTDLRFADLHLAGDSAATLRYRHAVLQRVTAASGLPALETQDTSGRAWDLICAWYRRHLQDMGAPDPILHELVFPAGVAGAGAASP